MILHIMDRYDIVDTVMDRAFHEARQKRSGIVYVLISSTIVAGAAFGLSFGVIRFGSTYGHTAFILGMVSIYLLLTWIMGTGNIESAVVMVIIFALVALLITQFRRHNEPNNNSGRSVYTQTSSEADWESWATSTLLNNSRVQERNVQL